MSSTADGRGTLDPDVAKKIAFQQAQPDDAEWAVSNMRPMAMGRGGCSPTLTGVGWHDTPSTYVVCSEDWCIGPDVQRQWATQRATDSVELPFDHSPQISHPVEVADLLATMLTSQVP